MVEAVHMSGTIVSEKCMSFKFIGNMWNEESDFHQESNAVMNRDA